MKSSLFGTDGIRGEANKDPLIPRRILQVAYALGEFYIRGEEEGGVVIGHDGRKSADLLQSSLAAGLVSLGIQVHNLGLCTTPALAHVTRENQLKGGIMISASHNPFFDNGIKPFHSDGAKLSDDQEKEVEELMTNESRRLARREEIGQIAPRESWLSGYLESLSHRGIQFDGHVVIDCSNGGASRLAPAVLDEICSELTVIHNQPDGCNINKEAGSTHTEQLKQEVQSQDADVGFAFDGDGDRVVGVDGAGREIDGDVFLYLLASYRKALDSLPGNGLVITVMSNLGLRRALKREGIDFDVVGVGDREVYREMEQRGWVLGGEQSGHIIDRDWLPTGDGLNTLISVLEVLDRSGDSLGSLADEIPHYPQVLHNIQISNKPSLDALEETQAVIQSVEEKLGEEGRVLVRYSGTEPVARIMLEGPQREQLEEFASKIGHQLKHDIQRRGDKNP